MTTMTLFIKWTNVTKYLKPYTYVPFNYKTLITYTKETLQKLKGNIKSITNIEEPKEKPCALLAKDSEWVDTFQNSDIQCSSSSDGEKIDCQFGHNTQVQPLALMFPGILDNDPEIIDRLVNKVISTTEMTKYLVGQKANFTCMKKVDRLIPTDKVIDSWKLKLFRSRTSISGTVRYRSRKKWLDSLPEHTNSSNSKDSSSKRNN